jgi:hypothetical protein
LGLCPLRQSWLLHQGSIVWAETGTLFLSGPTPVAVSLALAPWYPKMLLFNLFTSCGPFASVVGLVSDGQAGKVSKL